MSTHNIGFYENLSKIIFKLSSNTHLISSAVVAMHACPSETALKNLFSRPSIGGI